MAGPAAEPRPEPGRAAPHRPSPLRSAARTAPSRPGGTPGLPLAWATRALPPGGTARLAGNQAPPWPRRLAEGDREGRWDWSCRRGGRGKWGLSPPTSGAVEGRRVGGGKMAVQAVHLEADAFLVCLNHALSTEKEEVMGLCIGEVPGPSGVAPERRREAVPPGRASWPPPLRAAGERAAGSYRPSGARSPWRGALYGPAWGRFCSGLPSPALTRSSRCRESQSLERDKLPAFSCWRDRSRPFP